MKAIVDSLASLKLAVVGMTLLMLLVTACTLAQVRLGVHGAVEAYIHTAFVWMQVPGTGLGIPVFPGGGLVGLLLIVNLAASLLTRHEWTWRKAGLILTHAGVIVLVAGEFQTAWLANESMLSLEAGQTRNYAESSRRFELAIEDAPKTGAPHLIKVVPEDALRSGHEIVSPGEGILKGMSASATSRLFVRGYWRNAHLVMRRKDTPPSAIMATAGSGRGLEVVELPSMTSDEETDSPAALFEVVTGGKSEGIWLLSPALGPQTIAVPRWRFAVSLRAERTAFPFSLALKEFRHDVYPGTDIPRNFSSLVRLTDPARHEDRNVLIWMNHPLRYRGLAFYQASYGKNDTLSILQVVRNPGWLLPYLACAMMTLGLAWHFLLKLGRRGAA